MKIETTEEKKKGNHLGWKVYIDGKKFPKKPYNFYGDKRECDAVMEALSNYIEELNTNK